MKKNIIFILCLMVGAGAVMASTPEVFFSPDKRNEKVISDFVAGAKSELLVEAYSLTNQVIARSIKQASKRVQVKLICDKANAKKDNDFCVSLGGRPDTRSGLMHNKVIVRDGECVLTGSFNFTNNAVKNNRENFMIICDERMAKLYRDEFYRLWEKNT